MDWQQIGKILLVIAGVIAAIVVYFIPSLIAEKKRHKLLIPVLAVNLFLGFTLIGWIFSLAWALYGPFKKSSKPQTEVETTQSDKTLTTDEITQEIQKYKTLYDQGLITEEEFNQKKKQILNF